MVIPALPYKVSSPLKTRGNLPDLSEINFLLALVEIAKTIDLIYSSTIAGLSNKMASFTVICDGNRFNQFLNEKYTTIKQYQNHLRWWISKLGFSNYVEISDYQHIIKNNLPQKTQEEKTVIREQVGNFYKHLMLPLLDPYNMEQTINKAIECDPDPETTNPEGRFIPLFKSLIYTVRYEKLSLYSEVHQEDYSELYSVLTRHLFQPYAKLTQDDYVTIEAFIGNPQPRNSPPEINCLNIYGNPCCRRHGMQPLIIWRKFAVIVICQRSLSVSAILITSAGQSMLNQVNWLF